MSCKNERILLLLAVVAKYGFPIRENNIVNSVFVDDWTAELAIIFSNDVLP